MRRVRVRYLAYLATASLAMAGATVAAAAPPAGAATVRTSGTSLAAASAPAGLPAGGLWVLRSTSETALQGIANSAAADPAYRAKAQATIRGWASSVAAGHKVTVPGVNDAPLAAGTAGLTILSKQLAAVTAATTPDVAVSAPSAQSAVPLDVSPNNPNTYPVRGEPGSGKLYWTGMEVAYEADYCDGDKCTDEDKIVTKVTIDPGATATRISNSTIYSPDHGDFGNKHLEGWAINKGKLVGNGNSTNLPGAKPFFVKNKPLLYGTVLTSAVTLWVYFQGAYHSGDGAKTHNATCEKKSVGSACRYS